MSWLPHRKILVIDDNSSIHEDFRKILGAYRLDQSALNEKEAFLFGDQSRTPEQEGFQIDSAYQGQDGFEKIVQARDEGQPYALTFVDIRMPPGWDGVETVERIFPADPQIHAVICSAYSDYSASGILSRLGVSDRLLLLRKPCDSAEIFLIATAMCEKWKLAQATAAVSRLEDPHLNNPNRLATASSLT